MKDKTVLITGATDGIGKETARHIAERGARVFVVGRNPEKGAAAVADIKEGSANQQVEFLQADLSAQAEVRKLAAALRDRTQRLDVLVNNAGAILFSRQETVDGIEMTFGLNHLSYFLLTHELLDLLKASTPARIVNVASIAHRRAVLDFSDLELKHSYGAWRAYARSKLANIMFTYGLARRLENTGVSANCLHPGFVRSHFGQNNGVLVRTALSLAMRFGNAITVAQGAETSVHLATAPAVEGRTGQYFDACQAVKSNQVSYDQAAQDRLWDISMEMVG
ncbi:MAG: SDR family oxidoreductase [Proteobacteria bacterium]|nr:SDR family oxidoreductase [Pseudomonadota bacterium]MDA1057689.1 SDR family oxidoreductase [Pseudomonadota bacterium]